MPDPGSSDQTIPVSQAPTASVPSAASPPRPALAHLAPGTIVSRYRVEAVLGEGGMGTVYLARQERPDRPVALKVVRPGYATERMLRRFEMEAEVLGRLLHPGIAQIYEAGTADAGAGPQPFFAMELVKGVPLTRYAEEKRLATRERLELVAKVCDAVQHAHQKGVIHRDLKPGNILVTDEGQPKILDFGVARATDSDIQQTTLQTDAGAIIGTIPYMSPEQVGGDPAELDTRSDVYALGVIAYELLVGRLPYDLDRKMIHEAARIIREEEPTRLSSIDRALRGDVETIVAHALEKDKARRYGAASALAADIRRYLGHEPIAARPASTWYQVQRFSRRNRSLVAGLAVAFLTLVGGIVTTSRQAVRASIAEQKAVAESKKALEERDVASAVNEFLTRVLSAGAPAGREQTGKGKDVLLRDVLVASSKLLDTPGKDQQILQSKPLVEAGVRLAIGNTYQALGDSVAAEPMLRRAVALRRQHLEPADLETIKAENALGIVLNSMNKLDEAEELLRSTLNDVTRYFGQDDPMTLNVVSNLGGVIENRGDLDAAEALYRQSLEGSRRVHGDRDAATALSLVTLAQLQLKRGSAQSSIDMAKEAIEILDTVGGDDNPASLIARYVLINALHSTGRLAECETVARRALDDARRVFGDDHPRTIALVGRLGTAIQEQGRLTEAEPFYRECVEGFTRVLGPDHQHTLTATNDLGVLLMSMGRRADAEVQFRRALEGRRRTLGEEHPDTASSLNSMATVCNDLSRFDEAVEYSRKAYQIQAKLLGPEHPKAVVSLANLSAALCNRGDLDEALETSSRMIEIAPRAFGPGHPSAGVLFMYHGKTLLTMSRYAEAEQAIQHAYAILNASLGASHARTMQTAKLMVTLYQAWDRAEPGKGYDVKAAEWKARLDALDARTEPAAATSPAPK